MVEVTKAKFSGYRAQIFVMLISMCTLGFGYLTLGLYVPALIIEMNSSVTVITIMYAVLSTVGMAFSIASGPVSKRIGLRAMLIAGAASLVVGYIILYFATNVAMLYLAAGFIGVAISWSGYVMIGRVVTNWFIKRRGIMLGIGTASAGLGSLIAAPLISIVIQNSGWRFACLITIVVMAVIALPSAILIKTDPNQVGQRPLGWAADERARASALDSPSTTIWLPRQVASFVLVLIVLLGGAYAVAGFQPHVANFFVTNGFDLAFAGLIVSVLALANILGSVVAGIIGDRLGTTAVLVYVGACGLAAFAVLPLVAGTGSIGIAFVFAILYGLVQPISGVIVALMTARVFGMKAFPTMIGINDGLLGVLSIFAPIVVGLLYQAGGNYNLAATIGVVLFVAVIICGVSAIQLGQKALPKAPSVEDVILETSEIQQAI